MGTSIFKVVCPKAQLQKATPLEQKGSLNHQGGWFPKRGPAFKSTWSSKNGTLILLHFNVNSPVLVKAACKWTEAASWTCCLFLVETSHPSLTESLTRGSCRKGVASQKWPSDFCGTYAGKQMGALPLHPARGGLARCTRVEDSLSPCFSLSTSLVFSRSPLSPSLSLSPSLFPSLFLFACLRFTLTAAPSQLVRARSAPALGNGNGAGLGFWVPKSPQTQPWSQKQNGG